MAHNTGNVKWIDYPATEPLISAASLEAIENQLDRYPADAGLFYGKNSINQVVDANYAWWRQSFDTAISSTSHVTVADPGTSTIFTVNTSGIWRVGGNIAVPDQSGGYMRSWI